MYAPFRNAVDSTFKGDRKRYQQPVGSTSVALRSLHCDLQEGADICLVKPSLMYTDLIKALKESAQGMKSWTMSAYMSPYSIIYY